MDQDRLISEKLHNYKQHNCNVGGEDYKRIMPKIEMIEHLAEIEHSIYAVYDMHNCNYLLLSSEQKKIFGYSGDVDGKDVDTEAHYRNIHPDDLAFVLETDNLVYGFFAQTPSAEKKDYKLVYNFRTKTVEGTYRHYMHQSVVLEQDKNGKTWLTLVISHLLSDKYASGSPRRRFINMKTGKLHLFNEIDDWDSESVLSKRETEILGLIARGYDSINISDKLNISINTVNNHRQNILRKTRTDNTTQAVFYCKRLGII